MRRIYGKASSLDVMFALTDGRRLADIRGDGTNLKHQVSWEYSGTELLNIGRNEST